MMAEVVKGIGIAVGSAAVLYLLTRCWRGCSDHLPIVWSKFRRSFLCVRGKHRMSSVWGLATAINSNGKWTRCQDCGERYSLLDGSG